MNALLIVMILAGSLMSGYVTSEGKSSGYGVGSNQTESTSITESPMLGSGVGREVIIGSGG